MQEPELNLFHDWAKKETIFDLRKGKNMKILEYPVLQHSNTVSR